MNLKCLLLIMLTQLLRSSSLEATATTASVSNTRPSQSTASAYKNDSVVPSTIEASTIASNTTAASSADSLPGWGVALIVIFVVLIVFAIVAVLIYFLVIKKKNEHDDVSRTNKPTSSSKPSEEDTRKSVLKLPNVDKKKNTLPPINDKKINKTQNEDSKYTLSTEGNWRSSQRRGQENNSYSSPEKPKYENSNVKLDNYMERADLSNGGRSMERADLSTGGQRESFREGEERKSGPVPRQDLDEKEEEDNF